MGRQWIIVPNSTIRLKDTENHNCPETKFYLSVHLSQCCSSIFYISLSISQSIKYLEMLEFLWWSHYNDYIFLGSWTSKKQIMELQQLTFRSSPGWGGSKIQACPTCFTCNFINIYVYPTSPSTRQWACNLQFTWKEQYALRSY